MLEYLCAAPGWSPRGAAPSSAAMRTTARQLSNADTGLQRATARMAHGNVRQCDYPRSSTATLVMSCTRRASLSSRTGRVTTLV